MPTLRATTRAFVCVLGSAAMARSAVVVRPEDAVLDPIVFRTVWPVLYLGLMLGMAHEQRHRWS